MSTRIIARRHPVAAARALAARMRARFSSVNDEGMTTAEYAVGTLAAVAIVAVFIQVINSGILTNLLSTLLKQAFKAI